MTGRLRTSRAGLELIKSFEGFRDSAARLPDGRWIIGYGHVRTAREGLTISETDAEDLLQYDLKPAEDAVSTLVYSPISQGQFDALVSLAFNISPGQFRDSDILRSLNGGDFIAAANGFDRWRKARINGRVIIVDALVRRRTMEKALFLEHPAGRPTAPTQLVTPEYDPNGHEAPVHVADAPASRIAPPAAANEDEDVAPESDIAVAVKRLAERTARPERIVMTPPQPQNDDQVVEEVAEEKAPVVEAQPQRQGSIEDAKRAVAERLAKILERTEKTIADSQAAQQQAEQKSAEQKPVEAPKSVVKAEVRVTRTEEVILEGLPDFDAPKVATKAEPASRKRAFIDDTETFDPGRDPTEIFNEAVQTEQKVNGRGAFPMLNGAALRFAPWIAILILSGLGIAVGMSEAFRSADSLGGNRVQIASTVFAVFGLMLVMSIYFIATRARDKS